jgi:predicted Zn-dependent peptidase
VVDSWLGQPGRGSGTVQGGLVSWSGLTVKPGERLGPLSYRIAPEPGADGAAIFREASVRPQVTWARPSAGTAATLALRLNGLWGENGLRRTLLPTGLTIFTRERPDTSTASLRIAVRAGSRDEDDVTSGGSHWLEHAHFLGTVRRSSSRIDAEIAAVGGQSNAGTGWEGTDFWYLVPAEHFDLAIDLLSDMMINSTFRPEEFDREKLVVFEELKMRNDTPSIRAFDEFINLVFRVSPLRRHPAGTIQSVQSIPIETILAYRSRRYVTGNMAIAAVGNLRHEDAVAKIERAFQDLPRGPRGERPRILEPVEREPRRLDIGDGTRAAEIAIGWPTPGDDHPDSASLAIIEDILGSTGRRLTEEIRDRRALATSVEPSYLDFSDAGALLIRATTTADNTDTVIDLILQQIRRLRNGQVTDGEISTSLRAITGRRSVSEESNQSQTDRADVEVSGMLESYEEYLARLRPVRPADVQRVATAYLDPDNYTLVVVRP